MGGAVVSTSTSHKYTLAGLLPLPSALEVQNLHTNGRVKIELWCGQLLTLQGVRSKAAFERSRCLVFDLPRSDLILFIA